MGLGKVVDFELRFSQLQRPGQVMDVHAGKLSPAPCSEERIALGQEAFDAALHTRLAQAPIARAKMRRPLAEHPIAAVMNHALCGELHLHPSPVVRQPKEEARGGDGKGIGGVERKEVHTWLIRMALAHVGAQIQFREAVRTRNPRKASQANLIHPEGHHTHPGGAVEGIHRQRFGEQVRQLTGRQRPVRKQKIVPALRHHPRRLRKGPGTVLGRREDVVHA